MKKVKTKLKKTTPKKKVSVKKLKTDKEKKLFILISENLGKKKGKTMYSMMLEAGYAKNTALQQTSILCKVKQSKEYKNYIERLEAHKEEIIKRMENKIGDAGYGELSMALSRIETILLLAHDKPTSNIRVLSDADKKDLDQLGKENS